MKGNYTTFYCMLILFETVSYIFKQKNVKLESDISNSY